MLFRSDGEAVGRRLRPHCAYDVDTHGEATERERKRGRAGRDGSVVEGEQPPAEEVDDLDCQEIGRASCRERV